MGGKIRKGTCVVGGVVLNQTADFLDRLVEKGVFETRSKAIGAILNEAATEKSLQDFKKKSRSESKRMDAGARARRAHGEGQVRNEEKSGGERVERRSSSLRSRLRRGDEDAGRERR